MSDYISREELLKHQYRIDDSASLSTRDVVNVEDIEDCPSADVRENIHGEWIKTKDQYGTYHFTCSKCGNDIATKSDVWDDNFCSDCGADMRGEE